MANSDDFKNLAKNRLKTAELLIANEEWGMAAYILGFVLECILKSAACRSLRLEMYPEIKTTKDQRIVTYFRTHNFDMLLLVSGTSDIFGITGKGASSWSGFTQEYTKLGEWTNIRYDTLNQFDKNTVLSLYKFLTEPPNGIIPLIEAEKRW
jgi:hypothetical protein